MAELFDQIWRSVFRKAPILPQEEVLKVFAEMDIILRECMALIGSSPIVVRDIMTLTADVVGSLSHGRGIFARGGAIEKVPKEQREKRSHSAGRVWMVDPGKTFRYRNQPDTDAIDFMSSSLRLFGAHATGMANHDAIWGVRLSRASYESIIENFLKTTDSYEELSLKNAKLRSKYLQSEDPERISELIAKISRNNERLLAIEHAVGFSDELYGTLVALKYRWVHYRKLREKIYIPYLRIVFDQAKRRSKTSIQTLENFQNGAIGLLFAISNYNHRRGVFSSYANMWAQQGVLLKLKEEANPIKLPAAVWQMANKLNEIAQRHASASLDGSFDLEAVAKEAGIDVKRAEKIFERIRSTQMLSIDYQNGDDPDAQSLHETIESEKPDELPDIAQYLHVLSERQRVYVMLNYGLFDQLPGSLPVDPELLARERLYQTVATAAYSG